MRQYLRFFCGNYNQIINCRRILFVSWFVLIWNTQKFWIGFPANNTLLVTSLPNHAYCFNGPKFGCFRPQFSPCIVKTVLKQCTRIFVPTFYNGSIFTLFTSSSSRFTLGFYIIFIIFYGLLTTFPTKNSYYRPFQIYFFWRKKGLDNENTRSSTR